MAALKTTHHQGSQFQIAKTADSDSNVAFSVWKTG